jgi:hypothetical protein
MWNFGKIIFHPRLYVVYRRVYILLCCCSCCQGSWSSQLVCQWGHLLVETCPAVLPGSLARQSCPAVLPGSLARQSCPAVLPVSLARQSCPAVLPGSLARQSCPGSLAWAVLPSCIQTCGQFETASRVRTDLFSLVKNDLRSDQVHLLKNDLRSDLDIIYIYFIAYKC